MRYVVAGSLQQFASHFGQDPNAVYISSGEWVRGRHFEPDRDEFHIVGTPEERQDYVELMRELETRGFPVSGHNDSSERSE
jgi:hypothetical protein